MDKKVLKADHLHIYSYCPYYYKKAGVPTINLFHEVVTAMLSRILVERSENCYLGTRKLNATRRRAKLYYGIDIIPGSKHNLTFKMMLNSVAKMHFEEAILINSSVVVHNVEIPVHALLKCTHKTKTMYKALYYYYSQEEPSRHRLINDIIITSLMIYMEDTYRENHRVIVVWRDKKFEIRKTWIRLDEARNQLIALTRAISNDIIYKRIGKWCERCHMRSSCGEV